MDIDTCTNQYLKLSATLSQQGRTIDTLGQENAYRANRIYSSELLVDEMKKIVESTEGDAEAKFTEPSAPCKA
jgi:hypothetical protein